MSIDPGSQDPQRNELLAMIREGMKVIDVGGDDVGTVSYVQMADINDPDPSGRDDDFGLLDLTPDNDSGEGGLLGAIGLGDRVTERMERSGYVKIDTGGIFSGDTFVEPYQIASVEGDTVRLGIGKDAIGKPA